MVLLWLRTLSATMTVVISPNYWIVLVMVGLVRLQTDLDPVWVHLNLDSATKVSR